jgi:integrase
MRKLIDLSKVKHRYHVRHPRSERRRSYKIVKQSGSTFETISHPTLDSINNSLKSGQIDPATALKNVRDLVDQLYKKDGAKVFTVTHSEENQRLLERFMDAQYAHRDLVDPMTARYEFERAIAALGPLSLVSASREQLQKQINTNLKGNKQRRVVGKLNQLLAWLGRDFSLARNKESIEDIKYLSESEFQKILEYLPNNYIRTLHEVCFYGGFRIGEAFALEPAFLNKKVSSIKVLKQIDKEGVKRQTKNRRQRDAYIFPQGLEAIERWFSERHNISLKERTQMSKRTKHACKAAFPKDPSKWLKFHDLRHSYAIALLSKGVSIALVAQSIGDSIRVAEKHYVGFILSSESIQMIDRIVKG